MITAIATSSLKEVTGLLQEGIPEVGGWGKEWVSRRPDTRRGDLNAAVLETKGIWELKEEEQRRGKKKGHEG